MNHHSDSSPNWTGQIRLPWLRCGLLAGLLHPSAGLRWLAADGLWIESLLRGARAHPIPAFGAICMVLLALAPWKSLRTDLTDTSLQG